MANVKISDLTEDTSPATGDWVETEDVSANASKKVSLSNILPADSVTDAKLVYGKIRSRQGGSATDWSSTGTNNYNYDATNTFWQVGAIAVSANPTTVTFPVAFNQVPLVYGLPSSAASNNVFVICTARTTTTASFRCVNDGGTAVTTESINWQAVGE